jgi:hypothetical protein
MGRRGNAGLAPLPAAPRDAGRAAAAGNLATGRSRRRDAAHPAAPMARTRPPAGNPSRPISRCGDGRPGRYPARTSLPETLAARLHQQTEGKPTLHRGDPTPRPGRQPADQPGAVGAAIAAGSGNNGRFPPPKNGRRHQSAAGAAFPHRLQLGRGVQCHWPLFHPLHLAAGQRRGPKMR